MNEEMKCPWCGEEGFDLYGLKLHLLNGGMFHDPCEKFQNCNDKPSKPSKPSPQYFFLPYDENNT